MLKLKESKGDVVRKKKPVTGGKYTQDIVKQAILTVSKGDKERRGV